MPDGIRLLDKRRTRDRVVARFTVDPVVWPVAAGKGLLTLDAGLTPELLSPENEGHLVRYLTSSARFELQCRTEEDRP